MSAVGNEKGVQGLQLLGKGTSPESSSFIKFQAAVVLSYSVKSPF